MSPVHLLRVLGRGMGHKNQTSKDLKAVKGFFIQNSYFTTATHWEDIFDISDISDTSISRPFKFKPTSRICKYRL